MKQASFVDNKTTYAGMSRTLFMEARSKYAASVDVQGPRLPVATLAAIIGRANEFEVAVRGGRVYSLQMLSHSADWRSRSTANVAGALVSGGTKVVLGGCRGEWQPLLYSRMNLF